MVTYLTDAQHTEAVNALQRRVEIPPEIYYLEDDIAPLVKLTHGGPNAEGFPIKKERVGNPKFYVLEKLPHEKWTAINDVANYTAGDITFTVDAASHLVAGQLLQDVLSGEILHVKAVDSSTQITVDRSMGPTAAGAINDNTPLMLIGNVNAENGAIPAYKRVKVSDRLNYTEIFREPFGLSRTLANSDSVGPNFRVDLTKESWIEWRKRVNRAFYFGEPFEDTTIVDATSGNPARGTGGMYYWYGNSSRVTSVATTLTPTVWRTFARNLFQYGASRKVVLCSPLVIEALDSWKEGKLNMRPSEEFYNIRVAEWETGQGTMVIIRDADLDDSTYGTGGHGGMAFGVDPDTLKYKFMANSDVSLYKDQIKDGRDGFVDEYLGEVGFGIRNAEMGQVLEGIEEYAAS